MLHGRVWVSHVNVGEGVCATLRAQQQRVARRVIARTGRLAAHLYQSAVRVLALAGRNTLRYDGAARITPDVYHFSASVSLLVVVRHSHRVELSLRVVAHEHTRRVLPGDGRTGLDLRPRQFGVGAAQLAALGHEVVHTAAALLVARIPVLHGRILHLGIFVHHNLHNGGVQLVLVAHRGGAPFEVAHIATIVAHNEGALKLSGVACIDAEIGGQLHRAAHATRYVDKRTVGKHRTVECCKVVVAIRHHRAEVLAHQFGIFAHGLRY